MFPKFPKTQSQSGFTLIELLVVISIIALLSSIVMTSVVQARRKARDAKRIADIHQVQTALEEYIQDKQVYPDPDPNSPDPSGYSCGGWDVSSYNPFISALVTAGYVTKTPVDPVNNNSVIGGSDCGGYAYRYYRYPAGYCADKCGGTKAFYIIGINGFESNASFSSPGWSCTLAPAYGGGTRDWGPGFAWVTGVCE